MNHLHLGDIQHPGCQDILKDKLLVLGNSRTSERGTSISSLAFRSDCKSRFPMNVLDVVKNVRSVRRMSSGEVLRPGRAVAGAKVQSFHSRIPTPLPGRRRGRWRPCRFAAW
jgi:hypothetical protein